MMTQEQEQRLRVIRCRFGVSLGLHLIRNGNVIVGVLPHRLTMACGGLALGGAGASFIDSRQPSITKPAP